MTEGKESDLLHAFDGGRGGGWKTLSLVVARRGLKDDSFELGECVAAEP
jgi:hypothetical protein